MSLYHSVNRLSARIMNHPVSEYAKEGKSDIRNMQMTSNFLLIGSKSIILPRGIFFLYLSLPLLSQLITCD